MIVRLTLKDTRIQRHCRSQGPWDIHIYTISDALSEVNRGLAKSNEEDETESLVRFAE